MHKMHCTKQTRGKQKNRPAINLKTKFNHCIFIPAFAINYISGYFLCCLVCVCFFFRGYHMQSMCLCQRLILTSIQTGWCQEKRPWFICWHAIALCFGSSFQRYFYLFIFAPFFFFRCFIAVWLPCTIHNHNSKLVEVYVYETRLMMFFQLHLIFSVLYC